MRSSGGAAWPSNAFGSTACNPRGQASTAAESAHVRRMRPRRRAQQEPAGRLTRARTGPSGCVSNGNTRV